MSFSCQATKYISCLGSVSPHVCTPMAMHVLSCLFAWIYAESVSEVTIQRQR